MQQASLADGPSTLASRDAGPVRTGATNAFVINLMSSTTPVALTRPDHAGLKRFTFFVSRRREEGRERFRLHMGYFDTQEQAEKLLDIVRGIYPGAWAGLAPGRQLAHDTAASAPAAASTAAVATKAAGSSSAAANVPTAVSPPAAASAAAASSATTARRAAPAPAPAPTLSLVPDAGRPPLPALAQLEESTAAATLRNVHHAIASLDDTGSTLPVVPVIPELQPVAVLRTTASAQTRQPASAAPGAPSAAGGGRMLSDIEALAVLEAGAAADPPSKARTGAAATPQQVPVSQLRPEKPCYAVQLIWSVQPIALTQVPQLAIFSAYTLYGAEGNRDGRRWYGLRLGFFTDAMSAKQVAHYVRGDFATVSVVPVTAREREQALRAAAQAAGADRAAGAGKATAAAAAAGAATAAGKATGRVATGSKVAPAAAVPRSEFQFIDDAIPRSRAGAAPPEGQGAGARRPGPVLPRPMRGAPGKRAKPRSPARVHARAPVKPKTLEETLEILGAGQLQIDEEPNASLNDSGVRHLGVQVAKANKTRASKLSRLLERLSERLGD